MYDAEYSSVDVLIMEKTAFYDHVLESLKGLLAVENGEKHDWVCFDVTRCIIYP